MKGFLHSAPKLNRLPKTLLTSFCFFILMSSNAQPGSALFFEGDDDGNGVARRVDLPNILTPSYTKEAWINAPMDNTAANSNNIVSGTATAFWFPQNQGFRLSAGHTFPFNQVQDPIPLVANTWYHVAVTYDAATTTMSLYKNGMLVSSNAAVANHTESTLHIGAFIGQNYMKGQIDEVRIWNTALTMAEIRDRMVTKIVPADPLYGNLVAYYKADENAGTVVGDEVGTNDGNFVNGSGWVTSGAAIGDASVHDYVNATKTATITHSGSGESFTATSTSGSPDGIHVYRVDEAPANTTGATGLGNNNKYFGVFQVGGTAPEYTAVYDYGTNYTINEAVLRLFRRNNNSSAAWVDAGATQNTTDNTLTATAQLTGEFILGSAGDPLPVVLEQFKVTIDGSRVKLSWLTSNEINNAGFVIQRSSNRNIWTDLGYVQANKNALDHTYDFFDANPLNGVNYYRLKQIDIDGKFANSDIRYINFTRTIDFVISPNPSQNEISIKANLPQLLNSEVSILDLEGKLVRKFTLDQNQKTISIGHLAKGMYVLKFSDGTSMKFIKD